MKYIKLFENQLNLKRYLIDDAVDSEDLFYLWEVLNITDKEINFKAINIYNVKKGKFLETTDTLTMPISRFKRVFNIIYETNSHKDADKMFLICIDAKKYNL